MKILYVAVDTPIPGTHGGSVHVLELCRALSRRGHDVHLLAPSGASALASGGASAETRSMATAPVIHHGLPRPPRFLEWSARGRVRQLIATLEPDVVVDRFYTFGGAGIWAAHASGTPAVLEVNSPVRPVPGFWRDRLDRLTLVKPISRWRRAVLSWTDGIYATSRDLLPAERQRDVTVVTNGVDVDRFRPGPVKSETEPLRCVYVSSFRSWHGAEDLVSAVAACKARGTDLRVVCLGRGPRWDAARLAASAGGVDNMITFVGEVPYDDVPRYLEAAEIGLAPFSPSSFTALQLGWFWSPIKIFEYLAAGLVVTTIDLPEMRAILPDTVARFYPPGDTAALAGALEQLARDRAAVREGGRAARILAESRYTWDHQAATVETLLHEVVSA